MKIGIISHYLHFGYGGVLQNYALQTVLRQLGHNPVTLRVNLEKDNSLVHQMRVSFVRVLHAFMHRDSGISYKQDEFVSRNVEKFIGEYISCTKPNRTSMDFRNAAKAERCDAIIVGSDQIWRPNYDYVSNCFLDFATNLSVRKIAYAASFGVDNWRFSQKETDRYRHLVQQFDAVSVREDSGITLCRQYLDRVDAKLVLDPTMLLEKEDYIKLALEANESTSSGNLFTYILDKTETKEGIINSIIKKSKFTRFECMPQYATTYENVKQHPDECIYPAITKWLQSFIDAEFVITDSFHGTVFSIIFNKPFYVLINKERGAARFMSLLKLFGLENRIINYLTDVDSLKQDIDWNLVNAEKKKWQEISLRFIKESLNS